MKSFDYDAIKSSDDLIASCYLPRRTDVGLDTSIQIKPFPNMSFSDSYEKMKNFLKEEHNANQEKGFEIIYDGMSKQTKMNLLINTSDTGGELSLSHFDGTDQAQIGDSGVNPYKNIDTDSYICGGEIEFQSDYWHSIKNKLGDYDEDPLQTLLTQIGENAKSDVSVTIQMTLSPIDSDRWDRRYPAGNVTLRPIIKGAKMLTYYPLYYGYKCAKRSSLFPLKRMVQNIVKDIAEVVDGLNGYTRGDFIDDLKKIRDRRAKDMKDSSDELKKERDFVEALLDKIDKNQMTVEGVGSKDEQEFQSEINDAISRASEKANEEGFVAQMRFIVYGSDKSTVEKKANEISRDIYTLYSNKKDNASIQQRLDINQATSRDQTKQLILDIGQRKTGVDIQDKVRNQYRIRSLHKRRNKPMVVTRSEIASIMHVPSENVTERSIAYGKDKISGQFPD